MSQPVLKIGILGGGTIAQIAHLPALEQATRVQVCALCEGAKDLLQTIGRRYGIAQLYTDYATFLKEADIQAVLVAVPDAFHVPRALEALEGGKHVFVEKPLGVDSKECMRLIERVEETGLKLQVGSMKRHDPGIAFARRFIEEKVGPVLSVGGCYRDTLFRTGMQETLLPPRIESRQKITPASDPRADKCRYSLVTHGAHLFDTIRFLGGNVTAVTARLAEKFDQHSWHGIVEFECGGLGHFELTVKANAPWSEGYVVHGEGGSVEIKTFSPFYRLPSEVRAFEARTEQWHTPLGQYSNPYRNQLEAFARSVLEDEPVNPDAKEGLAAVRLLEAVEVSVAKNRRVELERLEVEKFREMTTDGTDEHG